MPARILIVENDRTTAEELQTTLRNLGYEVTGVASNTQDAIASAKLIQPNLALLDVSLNGDSGAGLALGEHLHLPVVYLTAHADRELQQRAKRAKPLGHIVKPFHESELQASIELALHQASSEMASSDGLAFGPLRIVAESEAMKRTLDKVRQVAASEARVVRIEGAGGTGKELIARVLHSLSNRSQGPFVPVMCSAIPDALIESALFGHQPGAFAGASTLGKGLFEIAHGGTLFFDDILNLTLAIQAKLLRVVQERRFRRLGSMQDIPVDLRVIGASIPGEFPAIPFCQVDAERIAVPTLAERREDILPLARHFLQQDSSRTHRVDGIAEDAAQLLQNHDWTGNVRELRSVIERALQVEDAGQLRARSIHFIVIPANPPAGDGDRPLTDTERSLVLRALEQTGGNQSRSAKLLGITRDMLRYRMKKMRLRSGTVPDMDATP